MIQYHDQNFIRINRILEIMLEFLFSEVTQTKSKWRKKFNFFRIWQLLTELGSGLMNWRIFFLNIDKLSELQRPGSSLFNSKTVERKKEFLKKLCFTLYMRMLCTFLEVWGDVSQEFNGKVLKMLVFKNFEVFCTNVGV